VCVDRYTLTHIDIYIYTHTRARTHTHTPTHLGEHHNVREHHLLGRNLKW